MITIPEQEYMSESQAFESAVSRFAQYLKDDRGFSFDEILNVCLNVARFEIDDWNERGGE